MNRRELFKNAGLAVFSVSFLNQLTSSAYGRDFSKIKNPKLISKKQPIVKGKGKLGYIEKSKKVDKGEYCANCKYYNDEHKACALRTMMIKDGGKKMHPHVKEHAWCKMFSWDKDKKKAFKKA